MTDEDSDFDEYNDASFDEAFANLIESLRDAENEPEHEPPVDVLETAVQEDNDEVKLPSDAVKELNTRIATSTLSPFDRFRSPRGVLSVTDLVSLDWCELQFLYTLEGGKKRTTDAMRQGHKIHKELENELHEAIQFSQITTAEETWALRFLNILFGLRELGSRGMTREFRVFGFIGQHLVNGVIDQISQEPDSPIDQRPMDAFVSLPRSKRMLVISDVKTRVNFSLPKQRNSRSYEMQLSLYHQLLSDMVEGNIDIGGIFRELKLDSEIVFGDGFLAEAGETYSGAGILTFDQLLANNTLTKLWQFLQKELSMLEGRISDKMEIEYRHQKSNKVIGTKPFIYNYETASVYITQVLSWWDGHRSTKGVEIEEAYKCSSCDFEEGCLWRISKIEELAARRLNRINSMTRDEERKDGDLNSDTR